MDDLEKFNETWLPEKEDFHSHLNMVDYMHTKRVHKDFEIKKLRIWFVSSQRYIIASWCI